MSFQSNSDPEWQPWPRAAALVDSQIAAFVERNPTLARISNRILDGSGVRLGNIVDHLAMPLTASVRKEYRDTGFEERAIDGIAFLEHPHARLPRILAAAGDCPRLALRVDEIQAFVHAHDLNSNGQHGDADSGYEEARFPLGDGELAVVARQGYGGFLPGELTAGEARAIAGVRERLGSRRRSGSDRADLSECIDLLRAVSEEIGLDRTVDEFFAAERAFFTSRNRVAAWQLGRQRAVGIGWANHDHHTYRSARPLFRGLLRLWYALGFTAREHLHSGPEAAWGAHVLEHSASRVVLFCDVDMSPEEMTSDPQAEDLPPTQTLGPIGLWCALHGSSIGRPGLHHLECEFDYAQMRAQCEANGFQVMPPFTDLPILKQCFTRAEIWPVSPERVQALRDHDLISSEQAQRFRENGAAGSHLEILQRWDGYRGFNRNGVTAGIQATDALRAH